MQNAPHSLDINAVIATGDPGSGACLSVLGVVTNGGRVRMLANSDLAYGQYIGPSLVDAQFQMVLEEGWHNIGIPMKNATGTSFASNNDQDVVSLTGDPATHNLWWYDSETSSGEEHGFFRPDVTSIGSTGYGTHAYGTWNMEMSSATDLSDRGLNYFIDGNNTSALPYTLKVDGATHDETKSFTTHDNWGGWNLIPNIYPATIDAKVMYDNDFFNNARYTGNLTMPYGFGIQMKISRIHIQETLQKALMWL